jgi:hypothetical protein
MEKKILDGNDLNRVMDGFDFEKVHAYMVLTNWVWHRSGANESVTPTIEKLRIIAEQILWWAIEDNAPAAAKGTGGFMAYKFPWGLKLTFEPFKSSTY